MPVRGEIQRPEMRPTARPGLWKRAGTALVAMDPRVKLLLAVGFGLFAWRAGPLGLVVYGLGLGALGLALHGFRPENRRSVRSLALFILAWTGIKLGLDLWQTQAAWSAWPELLAGAGLFGGRLLLLAGIGLMLAQSASTRQLGLALAFFLRPVLGRQAWKTALSLSLMLHFLPLAWEVPRRALQTMRLRQPKLPLVRRLTLPALVSLRVLGRTTWTQALALAARGLDREEAWRGRFRPQPKAWAAGLALLAAGAGLTFL